MHGFALLASLVEGALVGLGEKLVALDRKQERDVDVDALYQKVLDCRHTGERAGDLDHQVRSIDVAPESLGLFDRGVGIVRELGRYLEAHKAVLAQGAVEHRAQHVAGFANVVHSEGLVDLLRRPTRVRQPCELLGVE